MGIGVNAVIPIAFVRPRCRIANTSNEGSSITPVAGIENPTHAR
jgi:hypothetical protein